MKTNATMKIFFFSRLKSVAVLAALLISSFPGQSQFFMRSGALPPSSQVWEGNTNTDINIGHTAVIAGRLRIWSAPYFARAPRLEMSSNGTTLTASNTSLNLFNNDPTINNWSRLHFAAKLSNGSEMDLVSLACQYRNRVANEEAGDFVIATADSPTYAERLRLSSDGNLGIGNFDPTGLNPTIPERLNVLGNVSIGNDTGSRGTSQPGDNYLSFCGGSKFNTGTQNSDMLRMYRFNRADNSSELRVEIGDDFGSTSPTLGPDLFVIGGTDYRANSMTYLPLMAANITSAAVGIGTTDPKNRLEIKSDMTLGQTRSGLRLTNLTCTAPTAANPGAGVLSVDCNGDVIYVPASSGGYSASQGITLNGTDFQLGYACGTTPKSRFTTDREINMSNGQTNHNLYFNGGSTGQGGKLYMGIASCPDLKARLEIGSAGLNPVPINSYSTINPSLSGLRFTDLTMSTPVIANASRGVLSLDANGDVIWVEDKTGSPAMANNGCSMSGANVQLGEDCNAPTGLSSLMNDRLVPMNNYNVIFGDGSLTAPGKNRVGIGTACMPQAKLEVIRNYEGPVYDITNRAIAGINNDIASPASGAGEAIGVFGSSDHTQNSANFGGDFLGIKAHASNYGVRGVAEGGEKAFGGWFSACGATGINIGVFGDVCQGGGRPGTDWAGYFTGDIITSAPFIMSDRRIKENIRPIENALTIIDKIQPKKYRFNTTAFPGLNLPSDKENYGVIAQELEEILPSLIKETPVPNADKKSFSAEKIKTVNYLELVPILIQAVKEQQAEIEELKRENEAVKTLQQQIDELKRLIAGSSIKDQHESIVQLNVTLTDKSNIILGQNIPNPCDRVTTIGFYIPDAVKTATIRFATFDGKIVQSIDTKERGKGVINVHTSELRTGVYIYSLIADGKVIDTKRMEVLR